MGVVMGAGTRRAIFRKWCEGAAAFVSETQHAH